MVCFKAFLRINCRKVSCIILNLHLLKGKDHHRTNGVSVYYTYNNYVNYGPVGYPSRVVITGLVRRLRSLKYVATIN